MSLSEERKMILKMLEEGKITSEEAARLLEALDGSRSSEGESRQKNTSSFQEEIAKLRDRVNEWKKDFEKKYNQKDFDQIVDDFSKKAEKIGKSVAHTTFGIIDKVVDYVSSFVETSAFNIFSNYKLEERFFEAEAVNGMDLDLEGVNGQILVKKHMDDKILIRSKARSLEGNVDQILVFEKGDNRLSLKINKTTNISVAHEVFLPAVQFGKIRIETTNAKIHVEDTVSDTFECMSKNGTIDLMGVNAENILVNTKNARVHLSYVIGKQIDIATLNALIEMKNIRAEQIKAVTQNSRIFAENIENFEKFPELFMSLKTTNGDIKVYMNDMDNRGYKVKALTTNGAVNLLIPELTYHSPNKQGIGGNLVEAESTGYGTYSKKIHINAETTNGDIEIVK